MIFTTFPDDAIYVPKMLQSFDKLWHKDIQMVAFYEEKKPEYKSHRIEYRSCRDFSSLVDFRERHSDKIGKEMTVNRVRGRIVHSGYNYNKDAVKFAACSIVRARMIQESKGRIFWLDGDTYTHTQIPLGFIDQFLPIGVFSSYLGRNDYHTESGFIAFDCDHAEAKEFGEEWESYYTEDKIFDLSRWHDCEIFDTLRVKYKSDAMRFHNLTPHGTVREHVFVQLLGDYLDHLKGNRKESGESPELRRYKSGRRAAINRRHAR